MLLVGCAPPGIYYWGDYSKTLYQSKKDITPEKLAKHKEELQSIISKSNEDGLRVPPGLNAELGYLLLLEGENDKAIIYIEKEKETYPESAKFMDDLLKKIKEEE